MTQRETNLFRTSCLLVAMTALGACSSAPRQADDNLLASITDAGVRTWDRTMYLLGFDEEAKAKTQARNANPRTDPRLLDEVDIAMLKDDARLPDDATDSASVSANAVVDSPAWSAIAASEGERSDEALIVDEVLADNAVATSATTPAASSENWAEVGELAGDPDGELPGDQVLVSSPDMTHVVGTSETLWDIAKATTGDATNWHVLADVNDLDPDAAVYPGQTLTIPADMVRPELADPLNESGVVASTERLTIPGDDTSDVGTNVAGDVAAEVAASVDPAAALPVEEGSVLKLEPGEALWDFAKRTTGDALNWQAIARANGLSDDQATRIRPGQSFMVPKALLRDSLVDAEPGSGTLSITDSSADAAATDALVDTVTETADASASADGVAIEDTRQVLELVPIADAIDVNLPKSTSAVVEGETDLGGARESVEDAVVGNAQPVDVSDAAYQADAESAVSEASALSDTPAEIMVSGTYYPKAVYNDADFSSSLLMRVSPGTTLQVSRAIGPWFEVKTPEGTGFVHHRDIK